MFNVLFWSQVRHWETEKYQNNNKNSFINSDWLFMSICATRANFQPQNLAEMIHICLIFDTILRKHLTISMTLALLNQHTGLKHCDQCLFLQHILRALNWIPIFNFEFWCTTTFKPRLAPLPRYIPSFLST